MVGVGCCCYVVSNTYFVLVVLVVLCSCCCCGVAKEEIGGKYDRKKLEAFRSPKLNSNSSVDNHLGGLCRLPS